MIKIVNGVQVQMSEQESQQWLESIVVAPTIPTRVTALQGLLAIDEAGLSAAYESWATAPSREFAERAYINKALHWNRTDPVLIAGATALGLTAEQIDLLFMSASAK
jgi:hypothetical protein